MKALFLNPPFKAEYGKYSRTSRSPSVTKSGTVYYPLWLSYAAAYTEKKGIDIDVLDSCAIQINEEQTLSLLKDKHEGLSLIVVDTSTPSIHSDIKFCGQLRKQHPDSLIALMGTHVTALPEETIGQLDKDKVIDCIIKGEADKTCYSLARLARDHGYSEIKGNNLLKDITGLVYRNAGEIIDTGMAEQIKDMDKLPFITDLYKKYFDPKDYFFAASDWPEVQIITSRGCVARCTFCVYPHTIHRLKYRMRSAQNIFEEFQSIVKNLPEVKVVGIEDDTFSGSKKRTKEFCELMINSGLNKKIKWYSNERAKLDRDMLKLMKKAGCHMITVGYESANENILKNIDKKVSLEEMKRFSKDAETAKIRVHGCFMVGNYGETKESLDQTLKLALQLSDDTMQFFPLIVYPGTPDYERFKQEGLFEIQDYQDYLKGDGRLNGVVRTRDMSSDQLTDWCDFARKKFYLRPKYIFRKFLHILLDYDDFKRTVKSFLTFYPHLFRKAKYKH